jgi:hypothetical protein
MAQRHGAKFLGRFEESGLAAPAFGARERISTQSPHRWRLRLGGESDRALVAKVAQLTSKTAGFIDLGDLLSGDSRFEVRLGLGTSIVLSIARG